MSGEGSRIWGAHGRVAEAVAADVNEREHWDEYQRAFEAMLSHTSTEHAPWYVVPADHKWFSRLAAAAILTRTLAEIDPHYPQAADDIRSAMAAARARLVDESGSS